jgi:NADH:ubiquinone oxidoreductase subunit K
MTADINANLTVIRIYIPNHIITPFAPEEFPTHHLHPYRTGKVLPLIKVQRKGLRAFKTELMLNAANINFVAFSAFTGDVYGQVMVIMTISVAAAEVAVGIAILLNAYKVRKSTNADDLTSMRW